jgi:hypothetical protein
LILFRNALLHGPDELLSLALHGIPAKHPAEGSGAVGEIILVASRGPSTDAWWPNMGQIHVC